MDEPKRHVVEDYPASRLPEELRGDIDPDQRVTVSITEKASSDVIMSLEEIFVAGSSARRSSADIDTELRHQRDSWGG